MLRPAALRRVGIAGRLLRTVRRDERGFTLVEALVAMVTGVIVTGALFAILEISFRQSAHLSSVAQATRTTRSAMTRLTDELHSACLSDGFQPIIKGSTANKLIFVNGYDEKVNKLSETEVPPAELAAGSIHKDVIEYEKATGYLVDKTYTATSNVPTTGEKKWERFPWNTTPTSTLRLAEHVSAAEPEGSPVPVFKYFKYNTTSATATNEVASTLNNKTALTETELNEEAGANRAASVTVSFRTAPYSKETVVSSTVEKGTFAELSSQTIFALGAPNSEATIAAGPCE